MRALLLVFALTLGAALLVLSANYLGPGRPMRQLLSEDPRNEGLGLSAHYRGYVNPGVLVINVETVQGSASPAALFRLLLAYAAEMREKEFTRVYLQARGQDKLLLDGPYFRSLGGDSIKENPLYLLTHFSEHVCNLDGTPAYSSWSGGVLGVLTKQMEDFNAVMAQWLAPELIPAKDPAPASSGYRQPSAGVRSVRAA